MKGPLLLVIKPQSFFNLKYDIIKDKKIGQLKIPFARLIPSLRFGDISFNIGEDQFFIVVPLRGEQRIGFLASEYRLMKGDKELASAEFPAKGSKDPFQINWNDKLVTFSNKGDNTQIFLDSALLGSLYYNYGQKKEDALDIGEKLPIELQVFSYFAYKKYAEVSLGI